jgi:putative solute:sodium symporter small subunit
MYFAQSLQQWVGDLPLSYWLAAQGVILMFVFIVAVYATLANRAEQVQVNFDEVDDD